MPMERSPLIPLGQNARGVGLRVEGGAEIENENWKFQIGERLPHSPAPSPIGQGGFLF
jgi:hypothetical protein